MEMNVQFSFFARINPFSDAIVKKLDPDTIINLKWYFP